MTKEQALEKLELTVGASQAEITQQYNEFYNEFQLRITNAPTEHQRKIYQKKLEELDSAYEVLTGKISDSNELPNISPIVITPEINEPIEDNIERRAEEKPKLTIDSARSLLNLNSVFTRKELDDNFNEQKKQFEDAISSSPSQNAKAIYQSELNDLEKAHHLLKKEAQPTINKSVDNSIVESSSKGKKKIHKYVIFGSASILCILLLYYLFSSSPESSLEEDIEYTRAMKAYEQANIPKAIDHMEKSLENGNTSTYAILGFFYLTDTKTGQSDPDRAKYFFDKAIENGDTKGNYGWGLIYSGYVSNDDKDTIKARSFYNKSYDDILKEHENGNLFWSQQLADLYMQGYPKRDVEKALEIYQSLVDKEYGMGYYALSQCYKGGYGVEESQSKYESLLHTAATQHNNVQAMFDLFRDNYFSGNCDEALEWIEKAYLTGYTRASYIITGVYEEINEGRGRCGEHQLEPLWAIKWYKRAIDDINSGEIEGVEDYDLYLLKNQYTLLTNQFDSVAVN